MDLESKLNKLWQNPAKITCKSVDVIVISSVQISRQCLSKFGTCMLSSVDLVTYCLKLQIIWSGMKISSWVFRKKSIVVMFFNLGMKVEAVQMLYQSKLQKRNMFSFLALPFRYRLCFYFIFFSSNIRSNIKTNKHWQVLALSLLCCLLFQQVEILKTITSQNPSSCKTLPVS